MIEMTSMSSPAIISATSAPAPAEGSVDRMVIGWMKLSYSTPSTMYIVTIAASTSSSSFDSDASSAEAAPWNAVTKLSGRPMSVSAWRIAATAAPSDAPGVVSNEIVVAGNCAEMADLQRPGFCSNADDRAQRHLSGGGGRGRQIDRRQRVQRLVCSDGSASMITRYWFDWV